VNFRCCVSATSSLRLEVRSFSVKRPVSARPPCAQQTRLLLFVPPEDSLSAHSQLICLPCTTRFPSVFPIAMPHQEPSPLLDSKSHHGVISNDSPAMVFPKPQLHVPSVAVKEVTWNTRNLGLRLAADAASAASAAALIAPIITVIDRCVCSHRCVLICNGR
jgi:hypothetical protein